MGQWRNCALLSNMSQDPQTRETYHHGNLPDTLVQEGAFLLAELGIEGFSLRKLAKRTGVTVAAPSHHFGNAKGLLTAIAAKAFERLADQMQDAALSAQSPQDAVLAMCRAYIEMRLREPGYAAVMFRLDLLNATDRHFRRCAFHAFDLLEEAFAKAVPSTASPAEISTGAKAIWATTHGLTNLPMIEPRETEMILRSMISSHVQYFH